MATGGGRPGIQQIKEKQAQVKGKPKAGPVVVKQPAKGIAVQQGTTVKPSTTTVSVAPVAVPRSVVVAQTSEKSAEQKTVLGNKPIAEAPNSRITERNLRLLQWRVPSPS